jgi:hypothetical protein
MNETLRTLNRILRWVPMFLLVLFATYMLAQHYGYNPDTGHMGNECAKYGYCDDGSTETISTAP